MPMPTEKYVYGVVAADAAAPKGKGIGGRPLQVIREEACAALVSDITPPVQAGKDELTTHADVLQRALESGPVLPMQFGVVVPDEQVVREQLLGAFAGELSEQLHDFDGKVELHLRAVFDEAALMEDVVNSNAKVLALSEALRDKPPDATYYERIELGQEVAQTVEGIALEECQQIVEELSPLFVDALVNDPQHERVACDAAFLVEQEKLGDFDGAVDGLGAQHQGRLTFTYTGPHPPYSFVELPLQV